VILREREKSGPYKTLYDFLCRIDTRKVGKKVVEHLIESGCFDFTKWSRQALLLSVDPMFEEASKEQKESARGVRNFFSLIEGEKQAHFDTPPPIKEPTLKRTLLKREYELLGFYLDGHPLDEFRQLMQRLSCVPFSDLESLDTGAVFRCAFIIEGIAMKISFKNQKKFAILQVSDGTARCELPIWSEMYEEKNPLLVENQLVYAILQVDRQEGDLKLQCRWLDDLTRANEAMIQACDGAFDRARMQAKTSEQRNYKKFSKGQKPKEEKVEVKQPMHLQLHIDADSARLSHILEIKKLFRAFSGNSPVQLLFFSQQSSVGELHIEETWGVTYTKALEEKLKLLTPVRHVYWKEKSHV
jgi:DNA polymerase-3 subunit alpha